MYTPTEQELKELGFILDSQLSADLLIGNHSIEYWYGGDWFLWVHDSTTAIWPKSFEHLKQIINAFIQ